MVKAILVASASVALGACGYGAAFHDCAVACSAESGCPSGFACGAEGMCRAAGATTACSAIIDDGGLQDGAFYDSGGTSTDASDSGPHDVILTEATAGTVTEGAFGCTTVPFNDCPSEVDPDIPEGIVWYREFALPDFAGAPWNVTGNFQITNVHFGCRMSSAAASVKIAVYSYSGPLFAATLDDSSLTDPIGSVTATIGPSQAFTCTDDVNIPIPITASSTIAAGSAFVVKISATDDVNDHSGSCSLTNEFSLGANESGESCGSGSCSSYVDAWCSSPGTATSWSTNDAVIAVEGIAD